MLRAGETLQWAGHLLCTWLAGFNPQHAYDPPRMAKSDPWAECQEATLSITGYGPKYNKE